MQSHSSQVFLKKGFPSVESHQPVTNPVQPGESKERKKTVRPDPASLFNGVLLVKERGKTIPGTIIIRLRGYSSGGIY